jgi:hypothetical protein
MHVELFEDVMHVVFHGTETDAELPGDLLI